MARPTDPWRGLAPTSATEQGERRFFRRYVDISSFSGRGRSADLLRGSMKASSCAGGSMRHHNPARWPTDDGLGRAAPDDLLQPGMTIGAHDQKIGRMGTHIGLEYLSDRTPFHLDHLESGPDPMFCKVINQRGSGPQFLRCLAVSDCDDAHRCSRLEQR